MTCHSFNCFSIVWGQGNAPLVTSLPSSCYMTRVEPKDPLDGRIEEKKTGKCLKSFHSSHVLHFDNILYMYFFIPQFQYKKLINSFLISYYVNSRLYLLRRLQLTFYCYYLNFI